MSKFCNKCPRKLASLPSEPCPLALERINARMADRRLDEDKAPGCPWAVNSAEYSYCFWALAEDLHDDPKTDKEICQLLNITPTTLDKIEASIFEKLRARRGEEDMEQWIELLKHKVESKHVDDTIYMPDQFRSEVEKAQPTVPEEDEDLDPDAKLAKELGDMADEKEKRRKRLQKSGMPVHRSGTKTDIFGITSKKKLEQMRKNGNKN